jgi:hypothetical protein
MIKKDTITDEELAKQINACTFNNSPVTGDELIEILNTTCQVDPLGTKFWSLNGKLHRIDGPAIEWSSGTKAWYQNGKLYRDDGPTVERADGTKEWCQNIELHRIDGELHRIDGPAVEWADGSKEWWLNGKQYTEEEFNKAIK